MTDDPKKTDWSPVEHHDPTRNLPEVVSTGPEGLTPAPSVAFGSVLQNLKIGRIERKAAVKELEVITAGQIDVLIHQVKEAAKVKKTEATVTADKFLKELDLQFQEVVQALGLKNEAIRVDTLKKLGDRTAQDMKEVMNKDWPESMKDDVLLAIKVRWKGFVEDLMKDVSGEN